MAERVVVTHCPNCGAPVEAGAAEEVKQGEAPTCAFCHAALPLTEDPPPAGPSPAAPAITPDWDRAEPASAASRAGRRVLGLAVVILIIGGITAGIVAAAAAGSHHLGGLVGARYTVTTATVAAPDGTDFYVVAPASGSSTNVLRRVDPAHHRVVWSSPKLAGTSDGDVEVVAGSARVFAIYGTTVLALDAATGREAWRGSLSNGLASPCASGCAALVGTHLVALAKDGVVQAFDATTGAQSWSKRLNSTPRFLQAAGSSVLVDDNPGPGPYLSLLVMDAGNGAARTITPACPASPDDPAGAARPTDEDGFFVSPDGTAVTVVVADIGGCVLRYRLADGTQQWAAHPADDILPPTLTGESVTQDGTDLLYTNDSADAGAHDVFDVNLASGAIRKVLSDRRNQLKLDGVIGSTVVLDAAPSFDSEKPAVQGVDLASGAVRWQVASRVVKSSDNQSVVVTAQAPIVISCNDDTNRCLFEAVDVQTGTIKGSAQVPAEPAQQEEVHPVTTPAALIVTAGWAHVVGIDPASAGLLWKWPN